MAQIDQQQNQLHRSIADLRAAQKKLTEQLHSVSEGQGMGYTQDYNREATDALENRRKSQRQCYSSHPASCLELCTAKSD